MFAQVAADADDSELVRRYRAAGVVLLGKTNTPEYGITGTTESAALGPCRNPWNPDHIAGGSSGGAASADGGGHRAPGARQRRSGLDPHPGGLLRPGRHEDHPRPQPQPAGRLPTTPSASRSTTWSAARCATAPPCSTPPAIPSRARPTPPRRRSGPISRRSAAAPGKLRIAWSSETPSGRPIDPEIQAALERTAELLQRPRPRGDRAGPRHRLPRPLRAPAARPRPPTSPPAWPALIEQIGREPEPDELEPLTWASLKGGRKVTGADALRWLAGHCGCSTASTLAAFADIDVYLCPVLGTPSPRDRPHRPRQPSSRARSTKRQGRIFPFTPPFNFSGQPSLSPAAGDRRPTACRSA